MRKEGRGVLSLAQRARRAQRFIVHRGELTLEGGHRDRVGEGERGASEGERSHTESTEAQRFIVHRGELALEGGHRDRVGGGIWRERGMF